MELSLYNTLSLNKETFEPIGPTVGLYTCGPTVYHYAHIGNLRTALFEDLLKRTLYYNSYNVEHVMNVTDVGHLTGDGDMGEDKMEKGSVREGKTAWEIADMYLAAWKGDMAQLNISEPDVWCKATDYIIEQIELIKTLEEKGFTYITSDGVYFDTSKFPNYNKLNHMKLDELKEGARVEKNDEKKNPIDFALWKFSKAGEKRQMEWHSPWGLGFPGWHIECSAMSLHFLKDKLDIHCGGVDNITPHHTNEIAQSESATEKKFFNYWMHGGFMNVGENEKMAKSSGNFLTLDRVCASAGVEPLAFRYACLLTHYRKPMNYKIEAIEQAAAGLEGVRRQLESLKDEEGEVDADFEQKFHEAINDDLNMPQAVALLHGLLKSALADGVKAATVKKFDEVLGLKLQIGAGEETIPEDVAGLMAAREAARKNQDWDEADRLREEIEGLGYTIEDGKMGMKVKKL